MTTIDNTKKIVAIPTMPQADWQFIQNLRQAHDPKGYEFIEPHFTLLSCTAKLTTMQFSALLKADLTLQKSIQFVLRAAIVMPPLNGHQAWYAFLMPEQGLSDLVCLHHQLSQGILFDRLDEQYTFIPHMTIGRFSNKQDCVQLVNELNATNIELSGCIEQLTLVATSNDRAQIFNKIEFQQG